MKQQDEEDSIWKNYQITINFELAFHSCQCIQYQRDKPTSLDFLCLLCMIFHTLLIFSLVPLSPLLAWCFGLRCFDPPSQCFLCALRVYLFLLEILQRKTTFLSDLWKKLSHLHTRYMLWFFEHAHKIRKNVNPKISPRYKHFLSFCLFFGHKLAKFLID